MRVVEVRFACQSAVRPSAKAVFAYLDRIAPVDGRAVHRGRIVVGLLALLQVVLCIPSSCFVNRKLSSGNCVENQVVCRNRLKEGSAGCASAVRVGLDFITRLDRRTNLPGAAIIEFVDRVVAIRVSAPSEANNPSKSFQPTENPASQRFAGLRISDSLIFFVFSLRSRMYLGVLLDIRDYPSNHVIELTCGWRARQSSP